MKQNKHDLRVDGATFDRLTLHASDFRRVHGAGNQEDDVCLAQAPICPWGPKRITFVDHNVVHFLELRKIARHGNALKLFDPIPTAWAIRVLLTSVAEQSRPRACSSEGVKCSRSA